YCASAGATSATLHGQTLGLTERIPMRANSAAGDFAVSVMLPANIRPGTYHPSIDCSDGTSTTARLLIPAFGVSRPGYVTAWIWLAVGGLLLIGVGAVTGGIALRRRRKSRRPEESDPSDHSDHFDYSGHSSVRF